MEIQEINDYNRMCAEFLGWRNLNDDSFPEFITPMGDFYPAKNMEFHSDWNWIHEIIDAIEKLKTETSTFEFHIQPKSVLIKEERNYSFEKGDGGKTSQPLKFNDSVWVTGKTKKEAVIQAINSFLKWYEQNNK